MNTPRRGFIQQLGASGLAGAGAALFGPARLANAQEPPWPKKKPIRLLIGQRAGYAPDIVTRRAAEELERVLGQSIIVENKPSGRFSRLMKEKLREAPPDGYTLGSVFWHQMSTAQAFFPDPGFDSVKDFKHLGIWMHGVQLIYTHASSPFNSFDDIVQQARAARLPLQYGTAGVASPGHIFGEMLMDISGLKMAHVAFRGNELPLAVARNDVPLAIGGVEDALGMLRDGKIRAVAVLSNERLSGMPQVPTLKEQGVTWPGHTVWAGFIAPADTPDTIVKAFNDALQTLPRNREFVRYFEPYGRRIAVSSPQGMRDTIIAERPEWNRIIQKSGIKLE
jgi:tripartite-type tricarboxylate transporter receptor subunit TctC